LNEQIINSKSEYQVVLKITSNGCMSETNSVGGSYEDFNR